MKTTFIRYTPADRPELKFILQVETEPDGGYSIQSGCVIEKKKSGTASMEFTPQILPLILNKLEIEMTDLSLAIEEQLEQKGIL